MCKRSMLYVLEFLSAFTMCYAGNVDTVGREFIFAFTQNRLLVEFPVSRMLVTSLSRDPVEVTISVPERGAIDDVSVTLMPGGGYTHQFPIGVQMEDTNYETKGINVTSSGDISVHAASINDLSSDAFLVFPTHALGTDYYVTCYLYTNTSAYKQGPTQLAVVATEDNTEVTFELPAGVIEFTSGTISKGTGRTFTETLDFSCHTIQIQSFQDLTGTRIRSNRPVAVFSGAMWTSVSVEKMGDHLVEQMPPTPSWGGQFLTVPIATRTAGDIFRIIARFPFTRVRFYPTNPLSPDTDPERSAIALDEGEHIDVDVGSDQHLHIVSNNQILVAQFCKSNSADDNRQGDPCMTLLPPISQYNTQYGFGIFGSLFEGVFDNFLNIVVPDATLSALLLDGRELVASDYETPWVTVANSGYSAATLRLRNTTHYLENTNENGAFSAVLFGLKFQEAYAFPVGQRTRTFDYYCIPTPMTWADLFDNDCDGFIDEEIAVNNIDDEGDGLVDEDVYNEFEARPQDFFTKSHLTIQPSIISVTQPPSTSPTRTLSPTTTTTTTTISSTAPTTSTHTTSIPTTSTHTTTTLQSSTRTATTKTTISDYPLSTPPSVTPITKHIVVTTQNQETTYYHTSPIKTIRDSVSPFTASPSITYVSSAPLTAKPATVSTAPTSQFMIFPHTQTTSTPTPTVHSSVPTPTVSPQTLSHSTGGASSVGYSSTPVAIIKQATTSPFTTTSIAQATTKTITTKDRIQSTPSEPTTYTNRITPATNPTSLEPTLSTFAIQKPTLLTHPLKSALPLTTTPMPTPKTQATSTILTYTTKTATPPATEPSTTDNAPTKEAEDLTSTEDQRFMEPTTHVPHVTSSVELISSSTNTTSMLPIEPIPVEALTIEELLIYIVPALIIVGAPMLCCMYYAAKACIIGNRNRKLRKTMAAPIGSCDLEKQLVTKKPPMYEKIKVANAILDLRSDAAICQNNSVMGKKNESSVAAAKFQRKNNKKRKK